MSIRLLIAEGQEVARLGFRRFFEGTEIEPVYEAAVGQQAVDRLGSEELDAVLLSSEIRQPDAMTVLAEIKRHRPDLPVVVAASLANAILAARMHALGAAGILVKDASHEAFVAAIRAAAGGESLWTHAQMRRIGAASSAGHFEMALEAPLTSREREMLAAVVEGKTNLQIAQQHQISAETVKEHVQHILKKLGVADRTQAAVWAVRRGIV